MVGSVGPNLPQTGAGRILAIIRSRITIIVQRAMDKGRHPGLLHPSSPMRRRAVGANDGVAHGSPCRVERLVSNRPPAGRV